MAFEDGFLKDIVKRFTNYKDLGEKTFAQLEEKDFFFKPSPESNSIAIIVQHMHGNMISRFTNFLTEDGEKSWRKRDDEFEDVATTRDEVMALWNAGWQRVLDTINQLQVEDVTNTVHIRSEALTVYDALLRQLAHYPYHVGQIVLIGKMIKDGAWNSLSIPKRQSAQYNAGMGHKA